MHLNRALRCLLFGKLQCLILYYPFIIILPQVSLLLLQITNLFIYHPFFPYNCLTHLLQIQFLYLCLQFLYSYVVRKILLHVRISKISILKIDKKLTYLIISKSHLPHNDLKPVILWKVTIKFIWREKIRIEVILNYILII